MRYIKVGRRETRNHRKARGYALVIVLLVMPVLFLIAGTICAKALVDLQFTLHDEGMQKAFYIAEGGEAIATHLLSFSNYRYFTHKANKQAEDASSRLPVTSVLQSMLSVDSDGWYSWEWKPGDVKRSFTDSGHEERFRFRCYPDSATAAWTIEVEGVYADKFTKRIQVKGLTDTAFKYALFGNQELSEFVRGQDQSITGRVHSNGNLYFRPSGANLNIRSEKITAAGKMIRHEDAWGRPHSSGRVYIESTSGSMVEMAGSSNPASAFGSPHIDWLHADKGALKKWGGRVQDGSLGAKRTSPPPLESLEEGGYYHQQANIVIDSNSNALNTNNVVQTKTFYNAAEGRHETYKEIDVSKLAQHPTYGTLPPEDGGGVLVYSKVPIRLINGENLPDRLAVVSNANIYTQGDFNKLCATQSSQNKYLNAIIEADAAGQLDQLDQPGSSWYKFNHVTKKPAVLISSQRVYHLSKSWSDAANTQGQGIKGAGDPASFTNNHAVFNNNMSNPTFNGLSSRAKDLVREIHEKTDLLELNSAIIDGTPTVDERNLRKSWKGETNPFYNGSDSPAWANSDDLLENWGGGRTIRKRGSIIHMENAKMAEFNNSDAGPGTAAWVVKTHYSPPTRDYGYDDDLAKPSFQPPSFFVTSTKKRWRIMGGNETFSQ